jgi:YesN/AraC family two-component response regulator
MENSDRLKEITILFVEDDLIVRMATARFLKRRCKTVYEAENGEVGLRLYKEHHPDVVITDVEMPVMGGLELIDRILELNHNQPIIITTGYDDQEHRSDKVCINLIKPIIDNVLVDALIKCIESKPYIEGKPVVG